MSHDMEIWANVMGWEGIYQISSHGRIRSFKGDKSGRVLSNKNSTGGYLSCVLCKKGRKPWSTKIHRLVAQAFMPNPENLPEVNHKDGDKQNNHTSNLEWVTRKQNHAHALTTNPNMLNGMRRYNKFERPAGVMQFTLNDEYITFFSSSAEAGRRTGICARNINQVATKTEYSPGKVRKQAGGYKWKTAEDFSV